MTYLKIKKPRETMLNFFEPFEDLLRTDFFDESFFNSNKLRETGIQTQLRNEKDHIDVAAALPGYNKNDILLNLKEGYLTIETQKKEESAKQSAREVFQTIHRKETLYVGKIDAKGIKANLVDGILSIYLPKQEQDISQEIVIN